MTKPNIWTIIALITFTSVSNCVYASITCTTLSNGVRVIVEDHSADLVAVDVWVRAGSANESAQTNGVSHFIEHLLFKGTETRGPGQVDMEIESLGGTLDARTSRDWTHFSTTVASKYIDKSLDVMSDIIMHPKFNDEDIEHERRVIIDEIARRDSNPVDLLKDSIFRTAFRIHPYGLPIEGTRESVPGITRETIKNYYGQFYIPRNLTVVLVGGITASAGLEAVKKAFGGFTGATLPAKPAAKEPDRTEPVRWEEKRDTSLAYLGMAFPAPALNDQPDVYTMDVLVSYLGGGYQSWMSSELRGTKKLARETSADFIAQRYPGLAILTASAERANISKVEQAILSKLDDLRTNKISDFDLDRAKRTVLGNYAFDVETFSGTATNLGYYDTVGRIELAPDYIENIRKVTADDILSLAKRSLEPNKIITVVEGP